MKRAASEMLRGQHRHALGVKPKTRVEHDSCCENTQVAGRAEIERLSAENIAWRTQPAAPCGEEMKAPAPKRQQASSLAIKMLAACESRRRERGGASACSVGERIWAAGASLATCWLRGREKYRNARILSSSCERKINEKAKSRRPLGEPAKLSRWRGTEKSSISGLPAMPKWYGTH